MRILCKELKIHSICYTLNIIQEGTNSLLDISERKPGRVAPENKYVYSSLISVVSSLRHHIRSLFFDKLKRESKCTTLDLLPEIRK